MAQTVTEWVSFWLDEFEQTEVDFPWSTRGSLAAFLKALPRAGKALRFDFYGLDLPRRSVYDHVRSLGPQADFFLGHSGTWVPADTLGELIAFHDLNEILLGDIPRFTAERIAKKLYVRPEEKRLKEVRADRQLVEYLPPPLRDVYAGVRARLLGEPTDLTRFFDMVDQTDPIIAIWRYAAGFRGRLDVDRFMFAMDDFFTNPSVIRACDPEILRLVCGLQNRVYARAFAADPGVLLRVADEAELPPAEVCALVEGRDMHFVTAPRAGRAGRAGSAPGPSPGHSPGPTTRVNSRTAAAARW
jgi:hypothetical protein